MSAAWWRPAAMAYVVAAALLYLCVTVPLARILDRWERKRRR